MLSFLSCFWSPLRDASNNARNGLVIGVFRNANVQLIVKGEVTFNSNKYGMYSDLNPSNNLEINVENGSTLESCGNTQRDIYGYVEGAATFSGDGSYTCDNVYFPIDGTVLPPNCQACPAVP
jgi:hypothetical protein